MADIPAKAEIGVTTGPIRGSKKIHVGPLNVAMREIHLDPSSGEPPLRVYDTSGAYTDPNARIDIMAGLPQIRRNWIEGRGNVEANMLAYKTSVEKVFAAGDMRRGQSLVVWAIREGRQMAHSIDKHLMGETILPR